MANPERTVYSFPGTPWVYLVAICHDCGERVAFAGPSASRARDDWMSSHTDENPTHQITIAVEVHTTSARVECTMVSFQGVEARR
ncbi:TPA_asm: hypothetical protein PROPHIMCPROF_29 [Mycobacterium phage McProf]|nr:TPA_asm: hypothetical protein PROPHIMCPROF_29 [Mycobacterium phage McProf]